MTFAEIQARVNALESVWGTVENEVFHAVGSASDNANDTIYVEKAAAPEDFDRIALASLEQVLSYCTDSDVTDWFTSIGFRW